MWTIILHQEIHIQINSYTINWMNEGFQFHAPQHRTLNASSFRRCVIKSASLHHCGSTRG
jgi:hypothetical protein